MSTSSPPSTTATTTPTNHPSTTMTTTTTSLQSSSSSSLPPNPKHPNPTPPPHLLRTKLPSRPRKLRKLSPSATTTTPNKPQPTSPNRPLSFPNEIQTAINHLRNSDPLLTTLINTHQPPSFDAFLPPFLALSKSILYQQLAYKAGTSIYSRFVALCGGESNVLPSTVLALSPPQLRQIGVSARKASYLHDLAKKYQNGVLSDKGIVSLDDKSLFTMLTMVNGIGSWSVHMFMIFSLHRPDVLPVNDLQVRKGVQLLYGLEDVPRPSQMELLCDKWRPYRSVGAWYMWRLVEAKGNVGAVANSSVVRLAHPRSEPMLALPGGREEEERQHLEHQQADLQGRFMEPMNGIMNMGSSYAQLN